MLFNGGEYAEGRATTGPSLSLSSPILRSQPLPPSTDLVDRGSYGLEIILITFAYKWLYPHRTRLNRGNHEARSLNGMYGFEAETKEKYKGDTTFKLFSEVFESMPLATLISATQKPAPTEALPWDASPAQTSPILSKEGRKRFLVVHGGLFSKDGVTLDDIKAIPRTKLKQPGQSGLMMEILWADPCAANGRAPSKRGVGTGFGPGGSILQERV